MNTTGHWLARAGALVIVIGFLLPSVAVSCTVVPTASTSFSLAQLGSQLNQPLLYLVPLGALAVLLLAFLPPQGPSQKRSFLIGQVIGIAVGGLSIFVSLVSLYSQFQQTQVYTVSPDLGVFVLVVGYGLAVAGVASQYSQPGMGLSHAPPRQAAIEHPVYTPPGPPVQPQLPSSGPRLEFVKGDRCGSIVALNGDISIGRGSENQVQLSDPRVSRQHIFIRYAQGNWFVQDQNSSGGTFLNGRQVPAARLNSGDEIRIGQTVFVFKK